MSFEAQDTTDAGVSLPRERQSTYKMRLFWRRIMVPEQGSNNSLRAPKAHCKLLVKIYRDFASSLC